MNNEYRKQLIELVKEFVLSAREINGVNKISMIGSLLTDKVKPKDADILCCIEDNLELKYLAKLGRRLQGKAGSIGSGADIFLSNNDNEYLGRICIWKDCRPGVRQSCDAQNCGKREYLHDDLQVIKLTRELVANPPLVLYPEIIRNIKLPEDLEEILLNRISYSAI